MFKKGFPSRNEPIWYRNETSKSNLINKKSLYIESYKILGEQ